MPAKNTKKGCTPTLCTRRSQATGKPIAYATFNGKFISFGPAGSEAQRQFDEHLAGWLANGRRLQANKDSDSYTVADLIADYLEHARIYYATPEGEPGREFVNLKTALAPLLRLFRELPADQFGPLALEQVREHMIATGKLCRKEINARVHRIRRAFRWAASKERIAGSVLHGLLSLGALKAGRCGARESEPVRPVPLDHVLKTLPFMPPMVAAMVNLQTLTGARPDEVCGLRMRHLNMTEKVWSARLDRHKNAWRGHSRTLRLNVFAQGVIRPYLRPSPDAYLFSPEASEQERHELQRQKRKSKVTPSQERRAEIARNRDRKRTPRDRYDVNSYRQAIQRACAAASATDRRAAIWNAIPKAVRGLFEKVVARLPIKLIEQRLVRAIRSVAEQNRIDEPNAVVELAAEALRNHTDTVPAWAPNQLRHFGGTLARRIAGLDGSQHFLGHKKADVTQIYAELEEERGLEVTESVGNELAQRLRLAR